MKKGNINTLTSLISGLTEDARKLKKFDLEKYFEIKERASQLLLQYFKNSEYLINKLNSLNYDVFLTNRDRYKLVLFFQLINDNIKFPEQLKFPEQSKNPEQLRDKNDSTILIVENPKVFIGHGRSDLWARLRLFLEDKSDLNLETICFETRSRVSELVVSVLEDLLKKSNFAIIILTAEDKTENGLIRARQNVIHEIGLFQGKLGFQRVVLLKQDGVEGFSNIGGLQYIPFVGNNIKETFYDLRAVLKREGIIK